MTENPLMDKKPYMHSRMDGFFFFPWTKFTISIFGTEEILFMTLQQQILQENCQDLWGLPPTYCDLNRPKLVPKAVRHLIDPKA